MPRCLVHIVLTTAILLSPVVASAEPKIQLDKGNNNVVSMSKLSLGGECQPGRMSGRVVARKFDDTGVVMSSFTLEDKDGSRALVNVDGAALDDASMYARGWVLDGLQKMIRPGKTISIGALFCGAAGRVIMLDSISKTR